MLLTAAELSAGRLSPLPEATGVVLLFQTWQTWKETLPRSRRLRAPYLLETAFRTDEAVFFRLSDSEN